MRLGSNVHRGQTQRARRFLRGAVVERFVPNRFREPLEDALAQTVSVDSLAATTWVAPSLWIRSGSRHGTPIIPSPRRPGPLDPSAFRHGRSRVVG